VVGLAFVLRLGLSGFFGDQHPYITFYPAIMFAATLCGLGPGFMATGLSALLAWFWFLRPEASFSIWRNPDKVGLVVFSGVGVFMTLVAALYEEAHQRLAKAEKNLAVRASEEKHRTFFENIQEYVNIYQAVRDENGNVTDWIFHDMNARTREYLENTFRTMGRLGQGEPLLGRRVAELFGAEHAAWVTKKWRGALAGQPATYERSFGGREYAVTAFKTSEDAVGTLAFDITDRKQTEEALRESETLYRSLFTLAPSGVTLFDKEGRLAAFNDQAHAQLGYSSEEFARLAVSDIDADERPDDGRRRIACIINAGGTEFEARHRMKSGEIREVLVRSRPVQMGGATRILSVSQDITERKRAQEALRESDRRKSEFLAVLSHELRNPLAPIRNSVYLLERAAPGSEQATRAREVIARQTQHLTRLVDDLLDVTRISRGKIELHRGCVDLRDVVRRTCDDHRSMFEGRGVQLSVLLPPQPIWADVDATRISQVLSNLLQNAAKFTQAQGSVLVAAEVDDGRANIRVRDSGVGMEPHLVERLFEPFVQAERGLARTQGGLGLGLALVKGLTELHGGTVSARSEGLGHGSDFVVELPLAAPPQAESPKARGAQATARQLILIIEDNLDAAQTLAAAMELEGHHVHLAADGTTGIRMACELRPDVVLCNVGLPDVSGYDVARTLRADESLRATRLIAVTGYAQPEDRKRAAEAGFDAQVGKPAPVEELTALLSKGR
jgi:PAS domain S-box-containing protein